MGFLVLLPLSCMELETVGETLGFVVRLSIVSTFFLSKYYKTQGKWYQNTKLDTIFNYDYDWKEKMKDFSMYQAFGHNKVFVM